MVVTCSVDIAVITGVVIEATAVVFITDYSAVSMPLICAVVKAAAWVAPKFFT